MVLVLVSVGLLLIAVAIPLLRRSVGPNAMYGLRVKATLENEEIWYEANARSAKDLVKIGVVNIIVAVGLSFWRGLSSEPYALICTGVLIVTVLWYCVKGSHIVNQLEKESDDRPK